MTNVITLGDRRAVECEVSGAGVPLLLIHGAESDRTQFADLMTRLPDGIEAVSYDQRDTGAQVSVQERYSMEALADDAADVIEAFGWSTAHVLGTSYGGVIAQHLAVRHSARVSTLTLVSTTAAYFWMRAFVETSARMTDAERAQFMLDAAVSPPARAADSGLVARIRAALAHRTVEQHARRFRALEGHDLREQLGRITAPTLVVHGTDDPVIPFEAGRELANGIPNSTMWTIDGGRHATAFEFGDELALRVSKLVV